MYHFILFMLSHAVHDLWNKPLSLFLLFNTYSATSFLRLKQIYCLSCLLNEMDRILRKYRYYMDIYIVVEMV
jgi:hypothetical protein